MEYRRLNPDVYVNKLPAHKIILITRSPYFKVLFTGSFEKKDNQIELKGFDNKIIDMVLNFLYTDNMCFSVKENYPTEELVSVLQVIDFLQITVSNDIIEDWIDNIHIKNKEDVTQLLKILYMNPIYYSLMMRVLHKVPKEFYMNRDQQKLKALWNIISKQQYLSFEDLQLIGEILNNEFDDVCSEASEVLTDSWLELSLEEKLEVCNSTNYVYLLDSMDPIFQCIACYSWAQLEEGEQIKKGRPIVRLVGNESEGKFKFILSYEIKDDKLVILKEKDVQITNISINNDIEIKHLGVVTARILWLLKAINMDYLNSR